MLGPDEFRDRETDALKDVLREVLASTQEAVASRMDAAFLATGSEFDRLARESLDLAESLEDDFRDLPPEELADMPPVSNTKPRVVTILGGSRDGELMTLPPGTTIVRFPVTLESARFVGLEEGPVFPYFDTVARRVYQETLHRGIGRRFVIFGPDLEEEELAKLTELHQDRLYML